MNKVPEYKIENQPRCKSSENYSRQISFALVLCVVSLPICVVFGAFGLSLFVLCVGLSLFVGDILWPAFRRQPSADLQKKIPMHVEYIYRGVKA